jgi:proteasome lid subunit RPN8/RPN11
MNIVFRVTASLLYEIREDLERPHPFAAERVGFVFCRFGSIRHGLVILAHRYQTVSDDDYIDDQAYGAVISSNAFRCALEATLLERVGIFHVHKHPHPGRPRPSKADLTETAKFVPDFFHVRADLPHGAMIVSEDSVSARVWLAESLQPRAVTSMTVVGAPLISVGSIC